MSTKEIILPLLYITLGAGLPMVKELTGVVMVGFSLLGLWWVHLQTVVKEYNAHLSRQAWLWGGWAIIVVGCLFWGWAIFPNTQVQTYVIKKEDEVEFVKMLQDVGEQDIEVSYADGDEKARDLTKRLSALFALCGWSVRESTITIAAEDSMPGVTIWASKEYGTLPPAAGLLMALLAKQNIEARTQWLDLQEKVRHPYHVLKIFIGPDPKDRYRR